MREDNRQSGHFTARKETRQGESRIQRQQLPTLFPHVHVVDLPVSVLRLADATVGKGVAGVIRIHAEVEVVTGVSHGKLDMRIGELGVME